MHRTHQLLGFVSSKCLNAAVELNIPDILRDGPKLLSDLAAESEARPDRLRQVLRILYNNGIFAYDASTDKFSNNSTSELLLSDHWTQWRNWVDLYGNEFYDMAKGIPAACRKDTTRMPAQFVFDTDLDTFTYFKEQGWVPRLHKTLSGGASAQGPGILADYPWDEISSCTFLDVGGGGGGLVALVLREHKEMRSAILDQPEVIAQNAESFHGLSGQFRDIGDRVPKENLIAGDFLKEVPPFEIYTMKWCLHDWDDSKTLKVMANIRRSIIKGPKSRLVIFESLLTDGRMGRLSRYGDIIMWMSANGEERSENQWMQLAERTGWKVKEIYILRNAWPCAIELVPDWTWKAEQAQDSLGNSALVSHNLSSETMEGRFVTPAASSESNLDSGSVTTLETTSPPGDTYLTTMSFLEPWEFKNGNLFIRVQPAEGFDYMNFKWHDYAIKVTDARPRKESFHIDKHGFAFFNDPDEMPPSLIHELRSNNKAAIKDHYYPRMERLVRRATGAARVIIFDDTVRKQTQQWARRKIQMGGSSQLQWFTAISEWIPSTKGALARLKQNLRADEDVDIILKRGVQLLNFWRPLNGPVKDWPLGIMDYRSLSTSDMYLCDLLKYRYEERGQTVTSCHNPAQQWYYLDSHRTDEVTLIKIWDSQEGVEAKLCPHAAFKHPHTAPGVEPRESIEVRCFVIY